MVHVIFNRHIKAVSSILVVLLFPFGCARRDNRSKTEPVAKSEQSETADVNTSQFKLVDPNAVRVKVSSSTVTADSFGDGFLVPTFDIEFQGNDYVQILRCQESYRPQLQTMLASVNMDKRDDRKWAWYDSFGNPAMCKVATRRTTATHYQDITAQNGNFFYVINPCVSAEQSQTGRDDCSFYLVLTNSLVYEGSLSAAFSQKAYELAEVEARYDQLTTKLKVLIASLLSQKGACEAALQMKAQNARVDALHHTLLTIGASVAAGGLFLGARYLLLRYRNASVSLPKNGGVSRIGTTEVLGTGGLFASVASVALILQGLLKEDKADVPACASLQDIAQKILAFEDDGQLEATKKELISKSHELAQLNAQFQGYNEEIFNENQSN